MVWAYRAKPDSFQIYLKVNKPRINPAIMQHLTLQQKGTILFFVASIESMKQWSQWKRQLRKRNLWEEWVVSGCCQNSVYLRNLGPCNNSILTMDCPVFLSNGSECERSELEGGREWQNLHLSFCTFQGPSFIFLRPMSANLRHVFIKIKI